MHAFLNFVDVEQLVKDMSKEKDLAEQVATLETEKSIFEVDRKVMDEKNQKLIVIQEIMNSRLGLSPPS